MNKTLKYIILMLLAVGFQILIIKCLDFVFNWGINYNLLVAIALTLTSMVLLSSILGTLFLHYSGTDYNILINTFTPVLIVCLYYAIFIYGFVWLTSFLIIYPFMYLGGIKFTLGKNEFYQMYLMDKESNKRKKIVDHLMKKSKGENDNSSTN
jgi:hypothetical protein